MSGWFSLRSITSVLSMTKDMLILMRIFGHDLSPLFQMDDCYSYHSRARWTGIVFFLFESEHFNRPFNALPVFLANLPIVLTFKYWRYPKRPST
jgi:hypothetical protein